jgi:hypothetical protein
MAKAKKDTLKKGNASKKADKTGPDEKTMEDLILWLYQGYKKFGSDKNTKSILNIAVRYTTAKIGESKNLKISTEAQKLLGIENCEDEKTVKKALRAKPNETIKEHIIPVKEFWEEFKSKKEKGKTFTRNDAKRWLEKATLAIITKKEDDKITEKGWKKERPEDAYKQLGIVLKDVR